MDLGDMLIRRAGVSDAQPAAEVWLRSFTAAVPTIPHAHNDQEVRTYFRTVLIPRYETWVAVAQGAVVGVLVLKGSLLSQLYLDPEWRGCGIGDRLMALAKRRRPVGLELWVYYVNGPARRFYQRHGFVAVEWTHGHHNEEREPDVRYVWRTPAKGPSAKQLSWGRLFGSAIRIHGAGASLPQYRRHMGKGSEHRTR